ncbi:MAG: hypothetical protein AB8B82_11680 [Roseovarius sp.]
MNRRLLLTTVMATLALPGWAMDRSDTVQLTADQITEILSGNTITGTWSGTSNTQYFAAGGMTMYLADGRPADQGRWRANADLNTYESWWQMTNWVGYKVMMTNEGYAWANGDTLEPFEVLEGKQVSW